MVLFFRRCFVFLIFSNSSVTFSVVDLMNLVLFVNRLQNWWGEVGRCVCVSPPSRFYVRSVYTVSFLLCLLSMSSISSIKFYIVITICFWYHFSDLFIKPVFFLMIIRRVWLYLISSSDFVFFLLLLVHWGFRSDLQ